MAGLRRSLRRTAEAASRSLGLVALLERRMVRGLTVLMYHRVLPDDLCRDLPFPSLVMPASAFRAQLEWLAGHAEVLPLGPALEHLSDRAARRPRVAITFDDGYADNSSVAAPIAEELGLRLSFFVTTDFVGRGEPLWFDRAHAVLLPTDPAARRAVWKASGIAAAPPAGVGPEPWIQRLKQLPPRQREAFLVELERREGLDVIAHAPRPMSVEDVRSLARAGHEIASHGTGHSVLTTLDDDELRRELQSSRALLADWIGTAPPGLAYPNGDHDERVRAAAREAGYSWACTTRPGLHLPGDDRMAIVRRDMNPRAVLHSGGRPDLLGLRCELSGLRDAWRRMSAA